MEFLGVYENSNLFPHPLYQQNHTCKIDRPCIQAGQNGLQDSCSFGD